MSASIIDIILTKSRLLTFKRRKINMQKKTDPKNWIFSDAEDLLQNSICNI